MVSSSNIVYLENRKRRNAIAARNAKTKSRLQGGAVVIPMVKGAPDIWIMFIAVFLVGIGVIMVFSASYYNTLAADPLEYLKRQGSFAGIGFLIMLIVMNIDYQKYRFTAKNLLYITIFLLIMVFFFEDTNGSHRWIPFFGFNIQPSEIAKFTTVMFAADCLSKRHADPNDLKGALGVIAGVTGLIALMIYKEPDLGAAVIILCVAFVILLTAGLRWYYVICSVLGGSAAVAYLIMSSEYQMRRVQGFLDPWADPLDTGYQIINSYLALGSGGLFGVGVGGSRQKLGFLPEQFTDFIFSITGEELGFVGAGLIVFLFMILAWRGYRVALNSPGLYGCLLAVGITTGIVFQAALNLSVVTGLAPVTGITLPFISYGGSSLLMSMGSIGVLLNISRYRRADA